MTLQIDRKQKMNRTLILNFLLILNIEELAVWCPKKGRVENYSTVRTCIVFVRKNVRIWKTQKFVSIDDSIDLDPQGILEWLGKIWNSKTTAIVDSIGKYQTCTSQKFI